MNNELTGALSPERMAAKVEDTPKEIALKKQVSELKCQNRRLKEGEGDILNYLQQMLNGIEVLDRKAINPPHYNEHKGNTPVSVYMSLSDWHGGATQPANEIEGFGQYSFEILQNRILHSFEPDFKNWAAIKQAHYNVEELVIVVKGDMISGDIHEELMVTNEFPAPLALVKTADLFSELVNRIAGYFPKVRVEFVTLDNHGRLSKKYQFKQGGYNSYMYLFAKFAEKALSKQDNIEIVIHPMVQDIIRVQNKNYLAMHGHTIKGWGGYPYYGIDRRSGKEAMKRMQIISDNEEMSVEEAFNKWKMDRIDMGHFHAPIISPWWVINGSASGTDAYDHGQGRFARPQQLVWLVHKEVGEFDWTSFYLDRYERQKEV